MRRRVYVLFFIVVVLFIFQIMSFIFISAQFSSLNSVLESEINEIERDLETFKDEIETKNREQQRNLNELSIALSRQAEQQEDFEERINVLLSPQEGFTEVIETSIKGVVSVFTDSSAASGFIISDDGYIVTNQHVVATGRGISVLTHDKKLISAEIEGTDRLRDLALLKIEGNGYKFLELADSDQVRAGQKVIAIGNPLGLSFTVTEGIISAVDREGPNGLGEYIQTDVSLNPGNSGGPLISTSGKVVGINNFKIGDAESLGFALESNSIRKTINGMLNQTLIK